MLIQFEGSLYLASRASLDTHSEGLAVPLGCCSGCNALDKRCFMATYLAAVESATHQCLAEASTVLSTVASHQS